MGVKILITLVINCLSALNKNKKLTDEDTTAKTRDSLEELCLMGVKILVTLVFPSGAVDHLAVVLVDGPCHVLGAHHGAVQCHAVQGQQPISQHAHSANRQQPTAFLMLHLGKSPWGEGTFGLVVRCQTSTPILGHQGVNQLWFTYLFKGCGS